MKLKKYRVIQNLSCFSFNDGDALGKERYGFKCYGSFYLLDKNLNDDSFAYFVFNLNDCIEVPGDDNNSVNINKANSSLLTAIGDKPSKITIEF